MIDSKCGTVTKPKTEYRMLQQQKGKKGSMYSFYLNIPRNFINYLSLSKGNVLSVTVSKNKDRIILEKCDIVE